MCWIQQVYRLYFRQQLKTMHSTPKYVFIDFNQYLPTCLLKFDTVIDIKHYTIKEFFFNKDFMTQYNN